MAKTTGAGPTRRGTREQTRERLVQAALGLLHAGGEAAVSTVSVTRAAGLAQSLFYRHFASVEQCLATAAERIADEIRQAVAQSRQRMYDEGGGKLAEFFLEMFALASRQRAVLQLFLRHRSDPLALAGVMHRLGRGLCADLSGQLAEQTARAGLPPPPAGWADALADALMAAGLAAVEAHLEGRGPSAEESARLLAAFSAAGAIAVAQSMPAR